MSFKRIVFNTIVLIFGLLMIMGTCCEPPPKPNIPKITLNGNEEITLYVGEEYQELGATATDKEDGEVPVTINGTIDTSKVGEYIITYIAVDSDGHEATKERTVRVIPINKENNDSNNSLNINGTFKFTSVSINKRIFEKNETVYFNFTIEKNISNFKSIGIYTYISSDSKIEEDDINKQVLYGIDRNNFKENKYTKNNYVRILTPNKEGNYYIGMCIKYIFYRENSKLKEKKVNICSSPIKIKVVDNSLPSDPGEEDKKTILGIDSDNDGVRDDIQRGIIKNYNDKKRQNALLNLAVTDQKILKSFLNENNSSLDELILEKNKRVMCIAKTFSNPRDGINAINLYEFYLINTVKRLKAQKKIDEYFSNQFFTLPEDINISCADRRIK